MGRSIEADASLSECRVIAFAGLPSDVFIRRLGVRTGQPDAIVPKRFLCLLLLSRDIDSFPLTPLLFADAGNPGNGL